VNDHPDAAVLVVLIITISTRDPFPAPTPMRWCACLPLLPQRLVPPFPDMLSAALPGPGLPVNGVLSAPCRNKASSAGFSHRSIASYKPTETQDALQEVG
jgi:hypothetical protein